MLYEVITTSAANANWRSFSRASVVASLSLRITSYNVCYTKLLRDGISGAAVMKFAPDRRRRSNLVCDLHHQFLLLRAVDNAANDDLFPVMEDFQLV